jgi:glycosyltransferase involved in cell wall biosynthesis
MKSPTIALVYDRINTIGGAERVLQSMHRIWPQAPVFTSVYNPHKAYWAKNWDIRVSFAQKIPFVSKHHHLFFSLMPTVFESFDFSNYDIVLSVTSAEAKGIITRSDQLHISYLLTPTRYTWSHTHEYVQAVPKLARPFLQSLFTKHRQWDYLAAQRPDRIIAISNHIANRIRHYYSKQADAIIYPPVNTAYFANPNHPSTQKLPAKPYYLIVSRLVDYKSIGTVIKAFAQLPSENLIIVGEGRDKSKLQRNATSNIQFLGRVTDQLLAIIYQQAAALIFPQEEDFGIVAVEAQAAGTPVLAYAKGGATETVIPGLTGLLFTHQKPESIISIIKAHKAKNWYSKSMRKQAEKFDITVFETKIKKYVEEAWQKHLEK